MSTELLNLDGFKSMFYAGLNSAMMEAAEPIIEKALDEIEVAMRERLGQKLIGVIDSDFSMERMGTDIRIIIKQAIS